MQKHPESNPDFEKLLGFENQNKTFSQQEGKNTDTQENLLDPEDLNEKLELENISQRNKSWSRNPLAKGAVVLGTTGIVFSVLLTFLNSIFGGNQAAQTMLTGVPKPTEEQAEEVDPTSEEGKLKTELALSRQQEELAKLNQQEAPKPDPIKAKPVEQAITLPPPPQVEPQPKVIIKEVPVVKEVQIPAPPPIENVPEPPQTGDPTAEWERLAKIGSYGQISSSDNTSAKDTTKKQSANTPQSQSNVASGLRTVPKTSEVASVEPVLEEPILTNQAPTIIAAGSKAKATLQFPMIWEGEDQKEDKFTIVLSEPLLDAEGNPIFPKGTELLAQVPTISKTGLVRMSVTNAVVNIKGRKQEISLPLDAIQIRGESGSPLMARGYINPGPNIAGMDIGLAILGGVSRAAQLFTRPEQGVVVSENGIVVTTNNPEPDILAGVVEGAATAIIPQISARNQQAINETQKRGNFWTVDAGTTVQVYVNREIQL